MALFCGVSISNKSKAFATVQNDMQRARLLDILSALHLLKHTHAQREGENAWVLESVTLHSNNRNPGRAENMRAARWSRLLHRTDGIYKWWLNSLPSSCQIGVKKAMLWSFCSSVIPAQRIKMAV